MLQLELEFLFFILFLLFHFLFFFIFFWEGARTPPPVVFDAIFILFFYSGEGRAPSPE